MIWRKILDRIKNRPQNIGTYLMEILLIIFSILVAIQADRYQQSRKNEAKLQDYLQAVYQDLQDEQKRNRNNLADCRQDINSLQRCLQLGRFNQNDSLDLALEHLKSVVARGVFRTFPPTTFDIMLSTGDIALIKDLEFRNRLAATFSFRDTYIKNDLQTFDQQIRETSRLVGKYVDLPCLAVSEIPHGCLTDKAGFVQDAPNELFMLLRMADIRKFHLQIAVNSFAKTIEEMEALGISIDPNEESQ